MCGQALEAIKLLKESSSSLKIQRAQMRLKLSVPGLYFSGCFHPLVCLSVLLSNINLFHFIIFRQDTDQIPGHTTKI